MSIVAECDSAPLNVAHHPPNRNHNPKTNVTIVGLPLKSNRFFFDP